MRLEFDMALRSNNSATKAMAMVVPPVFPNTPEGVRGYIHKHLGKIPSLDEIPDVLKGFYEVIPELKGEIALSRELMGEIQGVITDFLKEFAEFIGSTPANVSEMSLCDSLPRIEKYWGEVLGMITFVREIHGIVCPLGKHPSHKDLEHVLTPIQKREEKSSINHTCGLLTEVIPCILHNETSDLDATEDTLTHAVRVKCTSALPLRGCNLTRYECVADSMSFEEFLADVETRTHKVRDLLSEIVEEQDKIKFLCREIEDSHSMISALRRHQEFKS